MTALAAMVRLNKTLTQLDVSCNAGFGPEGCEQVALSAGATSDHSFQTCCFCAMHTACEGLRHLEQPWYD